MQRRLVDGVSHWRRMESHRAVEGICLTVHQLFTLHFLVLLDVVLLLLDDHGGSDGVDQIVIAAVVQDRTVVVWFLRSTLILLRDRWMQLADRTGELNIAVLTKLTGTCNSRRILPDLSLNLNFV